MNKLHQMLIASALAASALVIAPGAQARTDFSISVGPPAPIYEPVPPPRPGWAWAPGYWEWNGHRHVWHRGYWQHERYGYRWEPHHWVQRGNHWEFERGHWSRG